MTKVVGAALVVAGAVLGWMGWQEMQTFGSRLSEMVSGSPSDNSMWMFAGAAVLILGGVALLVRR